MIKRLDLNRRNTVVSPLDPNVQRDFLGGLGLGARLMADSPDLTLPSLDPRLPLIVAVGDLTATGFPGANRICFFGASPLTGLTAGSWMGGDFGAAFARSGTRALVLEGAAEEPSIVVLTPSRVEVIPRPDLWGLTVSQTRTALEAEYGKETRSAVIGPAGERLVSMASVRGNEGHAAGRCGMGAVMGSKNVKAILAMGSEKPVVAHPETLRTLTRQSNQLIQESSFLMQVQGPIGTNELAKPVNEFEAWPTANHQGRFFDRGEQLYGERIIEDYTCSRSSCPYCAVRCRLHVHFGNESLDAPEFESTWALGGDNLNDDYPLIVRANALCNDLGVDTISTGNTVAFYREYSDTMGDPSNILDLVRQIGLREGVGEVLGQGTRRAAAKFGVDYAMQVKGLELAAYDPRKFTGMAISYSTANRGGCHSRSWTVGAELAGGDFSAQQLAEMVAAFHNAGCVRDSLIECTFVDGTLSQLYPQVLEAVTGQPHDDAELARTGERIYTLERMLNVCRGVNAAQDVLPRRLLDGLVSPDKYRDGMRIYYELRDWDAAGRPSCRKLEELGLNFMQVSTSSLSMGGEDA